MPLPNPKRKRGGPSTEKPEEKKRLYLIFDDWAWGYSIRKLKLSPRSPAAGAEEQELPRPFIRVEAPRGNPWHFAAVGTNIVVTHGRNQVSVPDGFIPIVNVRSRSITFGPGEESLHIPIYISIGSELFALDSNSFKMLSLEKLCTPRLEALCTGDNSYCEWSWCRFQKPPFCRLDVISYALHSDGRTILASTSEATFAFDTKVACGWERFGQLKLPFRGHAHFVPPLNAFVGVSENSPHYLCSCKVFSDGPKGPVCKVGKLLKVGIDEGPREFHVIGATLVYLGGETGTEFCLVQCVSTEEINDTWGVEDALMEGVATFEKVKHNGCVYRVITFSLAYEDNEVLTTGKTCLVESFNVPEETTDEFVASGDPVAFLL